MIMAVLRNGDKLCVGADRFLRILGIGEFNIDKYYYWFFILFKSLLWLFLHQQRVKGGDGVIGLGNWFSAKSS